MLSWDTDRKEKSGLTMKASAQGNFGVHGDFCKALFSLLSSDSLTFLWCCYLWLCTMEHENDVI